MQKLKIKGDTPALRRAEYPPLTDQIDAIMKMGAALREAGFRMPAETSQWLDDCLAVKRRIPKS